MAGKRATIEVGDLVEFRSQDKIQKFYYLWDSTAVVTDIYESTKEGKNKGKMMAKVFFATRRRYLGLGKWEQVPINREYKILLKRFKKVR